MPSAHSYGPSTWCWWLAKYDNDWAVNLDIKCIKWCVSTPPNMPISLPVWPGVVAACKSFFHSHQRSLRTNKQSTLECVENRIFGGRGLVAISCTRPVTSWSIACKRRDGDVFASKKSTWADRLKQQRTYLVKYLVSLPVYFYSDITV